MRVSLTGSTGLLGINTIHALLELPSRLLNRPNPIPRIGLKTISHGVAISSERARQDLGVNFRPFAKTAADTVVFFQFFQQKSRAE